MPSLTCRIAPQGPLVPLAVLVSEPRRHALDAGGQPVPPPVMVNGLIDTGASCTVVDPTVIRNLGLMPTGTVPIITPSTGGTPHLSNQFDVTIAVALANGDFKIIETLPVIEAALAHQGHEALIGRDILEQGLLFYNGIENTVTICF